MIVKQVQGFMVVLALLFPVAVSAGVKTDRVLISNGDVLTGEIKDLIRGELKFKTEATDTIGIDQELILRLISSRRFEVEISGGFRYYGSLADPGADGILRVVAEDASHDINISELVTMAPIEATFWKRIDGNISLGYNMAHSSGVSQFTLGLNASYSQERYESKLSLSSAITDQESGKTSRDDLTFSSGRSGKRRRWFSVGTASLQNNDELGIDRRALLGGAVGRYFIQNAHNEFLASLGAAVNRENVAGGGRTDATWEGMFTIQYWLAHNLPNDVSLSVNVVLFPGISESSRFRSESSLDYRHEIVNDLTVGLSVYYSTDNTPPPDSLSSDYGVTALVGYNF